MRVATASGPAALSGEIQIYALLRQRLLAEIPDLDEETLGDTLEGMTNLHDLMAELIRSALTDEALAEGLKARIGDMKGRLQRLEERAERKRALVLRAMTEADITKFTAPDFSASLRQGAPALDIATEDLIPAAYWKPQPPKLDKLTLLAALKNGVAIAGVALSPPRMQLNIRSK